MVCKMSRNEMAILRDGIEENGIGNEEKGECSVYLYPILQTSIVKSET